jgi:catechol 2,3-dioxygenase-like lactoylglutathione lyase family enzyme
VDDANKALGWYRRLGFEVIGRHRFDPGFPLYVFVQRGAVHVHLSEHAGDAPPGSVAYFYVDTIDDLAAEFGVAIQTQPWGREVELVDPCGNRIRVGAVESV